MTSTNIIANTFGESRPWTPKSGQNQCNLWLNNAYELISPINNQLSDAQIRSLVEERAGHRPVNVILVTDADTKDDLRIVGPNNPLIARQLATPQVIDLLRNAKNMQQRDAASFIERELRRIEESVLPGIRVKELLTPHYMRTRMKDTRHRRNLETAASNIKRITRNDNWRTIFRQLGYSIQQLPKQGHLLTHQDQRTAVVLPLKNPEHFSRMDENGQLPDGLVLNECKAQGAPWGILASNTRFRIFQANPNIGSATARYIEIDAQELNKDDHLYIGILAPQALKPDDGWLTKWANEARDFGEELRKGLEDRLRTTALPQLAKGLGKHIRQSENADLTDRDQLQNIEQAVLTLVFRYMFLLHVEARGYLPVNSQRYRPQSARKLAEDCRLEPWELDTRSTQRWNRLQTLVKMIRNGDQSAGIPPYNGSLFAPDKFPGAEMLENAEITDNFIAPAIQAIAFENKAPDEAGLDYAGLQIGHLGAIYESLLAMRLTHANQNLIYEPKRDTFRPATQSEKPDIQKSDLFYQTEKGGRKAGGVYYTRHEFVKHLLNNSLIPALDQHLHKIKKLAKTKPRQAADKLFDFAIVDPAMGSGHFLTVALDMMADHIELFLADINGLPTIKDQLDELRKGQNQNLANIEDVDLLRRLILKRCIYGVDISPMAVEVANVTLWLASFVPGLALSYLGSNLKCGDSLIGVADPKIVLSNEIPLFSERAGKAMQQAVELQHKLANISDITPEQVEESQQLHNDVHQATAGIRRAYNLWAADPLGMENARQDLELHAEHIIDGRYERNTKISQTINKAQQIANQYNFFHWPLEFPHVFHRENSGFDVVVGNPPWDKVKIEKPGFLSLHDPGILGLKSTTERDAREKQLFDSSPYLKVELENTIEKIKRRRGFFKSDSGYNYQGSGDTDLFKLFCERYAYLARVDGRIGVVLPHATFTNHGSTKFREWLFTQNKVQRLDTILNTKHWAFPIHAQFSIALVASSRNVPDKGFSLATTGPSENLEEFEDYAKNGGISIPSSVITARYEIPNLTSNDGVEVLGKLKSGIPFENFCFPRESIFSKKSIPLAAAPRLALVPELHEAQQREMFSHSQGIEVWKGRSFHTYDPCRNDPAGYADKQEVIEWLVDRRKRSRVLSDLFTAQELEDPKTLPVNFARVAFHDVTNSIDYDTVVACLIPPMTPLTHSAPYLACVRWTATQQAYLLGVLNSLPFDWQARRYVKLHLSFYILNMLCFPPIENTPWEQIGKLAARLSCVDERFADFAKQAGVQHGPLSPEQHQDMRAQIDALVAHAYGLTEHELDFIFTDFSPKAVTPAYRQLTLQKYQAL